MKNTGIPSFFNEQARKQSTKTGQPIEPVPLGTSATDVYVANGSDDFWIQHLWAANVTGGAVTYTLYFVPAGDSAATSNTALFQKSLAANSSEVVAVAVNHRLPVGAKVQALCSSANAINIGGWGYDQGSEE